jgi:hypothetical protein
MYGYKGKKITAVSASLIRIQIGASDTFRKIRVHLAALHTSTQTELEFL